MITKDTGETAITDNFHLLLLTQLLDLSLLQLTLM